MAETPYTFNENAAKRIARAVRVVERMAPTQKSHRRRHAANLPEGFFAQIYDRSDVDNGSITAYSWIEVRLNNADAADEDDNDWSSVSGCRFGTKDRSGGDEDLGPAYEVANRHPVDINSIVYLRRVISKENSSIWRWEFEYPVWCYPVFCEMDGGDLGYANCAGGGTNCTITYTIKDQNGDILEKEITPVNPRDDSTSYFAGTYGIAWFDSSYTWQLFVIDEKKDGSNTNILGLVNSGDVENDTTLSFDPDTFKVSLFYKEAQVRNGFIAANDCDQKTYSTTIPEYVGDDESHDGYWIWVDKTDPLKPIITHTGPGPLDRSVTMTGDAWVKVGAGAGDGNAKLDFDEVGHDRYIDSDHDDLRWHHADPQTASDHYDTAWAEYDSGANTLTVYPYVVDVDDKGHVVGTTIGTAVTVHLGEGADTDVLVGIQSGDTGGYLNDKLTTTDPWIHKEVVGTGAPYTLNLSHTDAQESDAAQNIEGLCDLEASGTPDAETTGVTLTKTPKTILFDAKSHRANDDPNPTDGTPEDLVTVPQILDDLADVESKEPSEGDLLQFNGTKWVPFTPGIYEIPDEFDVTCNEDGTFTVTVVSTKQVYGPAGQ